MGNPHNDRKKNLKAMRRHRNTHLPKTGRARTFTLPPVSEMPDDDLFLWYGPCGYWTTDTDKLDRVKSGDDKSNWPGVPVCPVCHAPGFQTSLNKWNEGVLRYEAEGRPRYSDFVLAMRDQCVMSLYADKGATGVTEAYEIWLREQQQGVVNGKGKEENGNKA